MKLVLPACLTILLVIIGPVASALPVFPGAEGFGTGWSIKDWPSDPVIYRVTTLNESGSGSLTECIEATGPRVCIFEVSGYISLIEKLNIENPYIIIAGQTAPFPGITIRGWNVRVRTHHVLLQHIAIRTGGYNFGEQGHCHHACETMNVIQVQNWYDKRYGDDVYDIVLDHVSMSWGSDTNFQTWYEAHDVTVSNSIISEPLDRSCHCEGIYNDGDVGVQAHGYSVAFGDNSKNITMIRNLLAHGTQRHPLIDRDNVELVWVNNLIYDYYLGFAVGGGSNDCLVSMVGNQYKTGGLENYWPIYFNRVQADSWQIYLNDNWEDDPEPHDPIYYFRECAYSDDTYLVDSPPIWWDGLSVLSAAEVENYLITNAGSRPADRDDIDTRIVADVINTTGGIIDWESDVGGYPPLAQNNIAHTLPSNPHADDDSNGYTNLEEWIHTFSCDVEGPDSPSCIAAAPVCSEGQITSTCLCGGIDYSSGYCCNDGWQDTPCPTSTKEYTILKTNSSPTIDGNINEFNNTNTITLTNSRGTKGTYTLLWDDTALYIAANVSDTELNYDVSQRDGSGIWSDDCIEMMFDTSHDDGSTRNSDDYKVFVNLKNVQYDTKFNGSGSSWDMAFISEALIIGTVNTSGDTDTGYTIEIAMPWSEWGYPVPSEGDVFGFELVMDDQDDSGVRLSTIWANINDDVNKINSPDNWGDIVFSGHVSIHRADTDPPFGCIEEHELIPFIDLWKYDSTVNPMWEVMEAVTMYYSPGDWCS